VLYGSGNLHVPADFILDTESQYSVDGRLEEAKSFSGLEIKIKTHTRTKPKEPCLTQNSHTYQTEGAVPHTKPNK
jgi:hypothetical protein